MSNPSQSNQQPLNEDSNKSIEELTDDLDFWNIDTDKSNAVADADALAELEEMLAEVEEPEPQRFIAKIEPTVEAFKEEVKTSSQDQDIDQLLDNAKAKIIAEREMQESLAFSDDSINKPKKINIPNTQAEKFATIFCYIALVGIFTFLIIYASEQHNFDTSKPYAGNTPVEGEFANVASIETWWSEPIGKKARLGVILVPSATITLDSDSKSGVLRSVFYSDEEGLLGQLRPKGDPFTHEFLDGKFLESGTNQITIQGTDGFEKLAHYEYYRSQDDTRWTIEVKEAATIQTSIDGFKSLANAPIEPIRK